MNRCLVTLLLLASCSRAAPQSDAAPAQAGRSYGAVMADVGRRFELAGRAASANRFELAAFEVDEMLELFDGELPHAALPKEGPTAALSAMAADFGKTHPPKLIDAARAKDGRAFAGAFASASAACNACHQSSGHGFIQIPTAPGKAVPDMDPITP